MILDTTTRSIQLVLAGAVATTQPQFTAHYADHGDGPPETYAVTSNVGALTSAVAVVAVPSPASGKQRQVKLLTVFNGDTAAVILSALFVDTKSTPTTSIVLTKVTLLPGQTLQYTYPEGFSAIDSGGALKAASGGGVAPIEWGGLVQSSDLPTIAAAVTANGVGYWAYMGRTTRAIVANFVELALTVVAAAGAQTAELGLFSSPLPPRIVGQSLTKLVATGAIDSLTVGVGVKRNTADFATPVAAGVHLWAGFREAMAGGRPTLTGLTLDMAEGRILTTAAPGVLTGAGPFAGAIVAHSVAWQCPDLRLVCT